jgi:DnaK suppressor protein
MHQADIEKFRVQLLRMKASLAEVAGTVEESTRTVELDQAKVGRLSRMDAMQGQQMAKETARRRELRLARIDGALRRIEAGDFGYCFVCGEPIDRRRLQVDPAATRCIGCQAD